MEAKESGTEWTKENVQKLLAAMKSNIPESKRVIAYNQGLKTLDWQKVAFPPFSPEECEQKWREIFQKMRKVRSLSELIVEAEEVISDPHKNRKSSSIQSQRKRLNVLQHQSTIVASPHARGPVEFIQHLSKSLIHPAFPKRPRPATAIYYSENYSKLQKQHPGINNSGLMKIAIKQFKGLPDKAKARYMDQFKKLFKEYTEKKLELRQNYGISNRKRKRKKAVPENTSEDEDGLPPKPPVSGYILFCKEISGEEDVPKKSYIREWSQRWRNLSEKERCAYVIRCKELKNQYATKLHNYLMRFDEEKRQQILHKNKLKIPVIHKTSRTRIKLLPGEPKKPSTCAHVCFFQEQMQLLKEEIPNGNDRFAAVSKMWQQLSRKEQEQYKIKIHEKQKKYLMELQEWFESLTADKQKEYQKHNNHKWKILNKMQVKVYDKEELYSKQPSDSDDEVTDHSSDYNNEEENILDLNEEDEEEEEEEKDDMFEMYL